MRRASFLLLFLLLSSLTLITTPTHAATQDWKLWYDTGNGYLQMSTTALSNATQFSIFVIGRPLYPHSHDPLVVLWSSASSGIWFVIRQPVTKLHLAIGNGSTVNLFPGDGPEVELGVPGFYGVTWSTQTHNATFYYYNPWTKQLARSNVTIKTNQVGKITALRIGSSQGYWGVISGDLSANFVFYEILIYNRTLSPSEVEELYSDPWNPPTAGLLIWFAPWSIQGNTWVNLGSLGGYATMYGSYYVLDTQPIPTKSDQAYGINTALGALVNQLRFRTMNYTLVFFLKNQIATGRRTIAQVLNPTAFKYDFAINLWNTSQTDVYWGNGTSYVTAAFKYPLVAPHNQVVMLSYVRKVPAFYYNALVSGLTQLYIYKNDELKLSKTLTNDPINWTTLPLQLGGGYAGPANVTFYQVLVYDRPLNESEIREIYSHPLSPPLDGLEMWFTPWSFNTSSRTWINVAPIWPGVNLSVSNESLVPSSSVIISPVSVPTLSVYDIENNSEIPISNVSVAMVSNNTTISLIPSLLTLPYNETVTLNVSATGYLPRLLQTPTSITSLAVYLYPAPSENSTTTPPNWTNNFTMPDINGTGWSGWQIGKEALSLNFDKAIQLFFTQNPNSKAQVFLPFAIWLGMTVLGLVFSQSPLVALTLGVITQASLAGLGAKLDMRLLPGVVTLYLFLFIWILKDFIESRKAD